MRKIHNKEKGCGSSLVIFVMLLVLVPVGLSHFSEVSIEVNAQTTSSCDRNVVSLVDCSPSTSSSPATVVDDSDKKDNNDGDNDKGDASEEQRDEKNSRDIESEIPSTAGGGVPFP